MNAVDVPEDSDLEIPDPNPAVLALYTPQATNENSSKARKINFNLDNLRRSVRIRAQSNPDASIVEKAQEIVAARYNLRGSTRGILLLSCFPYSRLTEEEIAELFRAYHIRLGVNDLNTTQVVQAIRMLDRKQFEDLLRQVFESLRSHNSDYCLILDQDEQGCLNIL